MVMFCLVWLRAVIEFMYSNFFIFSLSVVFIMLAVLVILMVCRCWVLVGLKEMIVV